MGKTWIAVAAGAALILGPITLVVVVAMGTEAAAGTDPAWNCAATGTPGPAPPWKTEGSWSAEQVGNAAIIVEVGVTTKVPPYGWTIAVATAMQESSLRNLDHGDRDSLGLFQQRPSQGWGTRQQILDPRYAAGKFYDKLLKVKDWQSMPLTDAAQAVQISGLPHAYAKWQPDAQHLVDLIQKRLGVDCTAGGAGGTGTWRRPLPDGKYEVGSPFGPRGGRMHRGVDLMAAFGTPIYAAAAGTVTYAGCNSAYCDRPGSPQTSGCGFMIEIQHAGNVGTTYCHASVLLVAAGQKVQAGQHIANVGSTGHSSGNHLHFQVHQPAPPITNRTAIDPIPFMRGVGAGL